MGGGRAANRFMGERDSWVRDVISRRGEKGETLQFAILIDARFGHPRAMCLSEGPYMSRQPKMESDLMVLPAPAWAETSCDRHESLKPGAWAMCRDSRATSRVAMEWHAAMLRWGVFSMRSSVSCDGMCSRTWTRAGPGEERERETSDAWDASIEDMASGFTGGADSSKRSLRCVKVQPSRMFAAQPRSTMGLQTASDLQSCLER